MLVFLLASWVAPADLGSVDWERREAATARLRGLGAFGLLLSPPDSLEAQTRYHDATKGAAGFLRDLRIAQTWFADHEPTQADIVFFVLSRDARYAVERAAKRFQFVPAQLYHGDSETEWSFDDCECESSVSMWLDLARLGASWRLAGNR